jgi:hypothetical protein
VHADICAQPHRDGRLHRARQFSDDSRPWKGQAVSLHLRLLVVCVAVIAPLDELLLSLLCCCRNEGQGVLCQTQQSVAPVCILTCGCMAKVTSLQQLCLLTCFCSAEDPEGAGDARWRRDAQSDGVLPVPMLWQSASSAYIFQASHVTTFGSSTCVRL